MLLVCVKDEIKDEIILVANLVNVHCSTDADAHAIAVGRIGRVRL